MKAENDTGDVGGGEWRLMKQEQNKGYYEKRKENLEREKEEAELRAERAKKEAEEEKARMRARLALDPEAHGGPLPDITLNIIEDIPPRTGTGLEVEWVQRRVDEKMRKLRALGESGDTTMQPGREEEVREVPGGEQAEIAKNEAEEIRARDCDILLLDPESSSSSLSLNS